MSRPGAAGRSLRAPALDWGSAAIPVDGLGRSSALAPAAQTPTVDAVDWARAAMPVGPDGCSDPAANVGTVSAWRPDLALRQPRTGKTFSLRALLRGFRDAGLPPHPLGEDADDALIERIRGLLGARDRDPPEDADLRCDWMGIDRARSPWEGPGADPFFHGRPFPDSQETLHATDDGEHYGYFDEVLRDIADLRGSYFRESVGVDLTWHYLHLDAAIPAPADLLTDLTESRFARMHRFWCMVIVAIATNTRIVPTIFARGGGEGLNPDSHPPNDTIHDPVTAQSLPGFEATTYADVLAQKAAHQRSVIVPSAFGWDEWYFDTTAADALFQRFCLNVYNEDATALDQPARASAPEGLIALRKSLALAAFGEAVGRGMFALEQALRGQGLRLSDTIPHLELGAEMDAQWAFTEGLDLAAPSNTWGPRQSAREYARFHAVLAASIHAWWPRARFKCSEIASAADAEQGTARFAWMGNALAEQLGLEVDLLNRVAELKMFHDAGLDISHYDADPFYGPALDWVNAAADAGVDFPSAGATFSAPDLVQLVGLHWFHYSEPVYDGGAYVSGYQNESVLLQYTLEPLRIYLMNPCRAAGLTVQWAVGNLGFPSGVTYGDAQSGALAPLYGANSQEMQACHLVRSMLTFIGYGATHVFWYAHMEARERFDADSSAAGLFTSMGLRNDDAVDEVPAASTDAWQKASWWAYQRLATLLAHAAAVEVLFNADGGVLIRITGGPNGLRAPDGSRTWRYAYVFWLDGGDPNAGTTAEVVLTLNVLAAYELLSLVPAETRRLRDADTGRRYARSNEPDWSAGSAQCLQAISHRWVWSDPWTVGAEVVTVTLVPTLPTTNYGLVAWLTDASSAAMTVTP